MCQRTGATARESLWRDLSGGLTSPAFSFHTCGSASPFAHAVLTVAKSYCNCFSSHIVHAITAFSIITAISMITCSSHLCLQLCTVPVANPAWSLLLTPHSQNVMSAAGLCCVSWCMCASLCPLLLLHSNKFVCFMKLARANAFRIRSIQTTFDKSFSCVLWLLFNKSRPFCRNATVQSDARPLGRAGNRSTRCRCFSDGRCGANIFAACD